MEIQRMNKLRTFANVLFEKSKDSGGSECSVSTAVSISKGNSGNKSNLIS
jgi:hypothetical protein